MNPFFTCLSSMCHFDLSADPESVKIDAIPLTWNSALPLWTAKQSELMLEPPTMIHVRGFADIWKSENIATAAELHAQVTEIIEAPPPYGMWI